MIPLLSVLHVLATNRPRVPRRQQGLQKCSVVAHPRARRSTAQSNVQLLRPPYKDVHPDSGYATAKFDGGLTDQGVTRFKETAEAWEFYQKQPPGYRRQTVRWVMSAKREETRERRLTTLIDDSGNRLRIKQLRKG